MIHRSLATAFAALLFAFAGFSAQAQHPVNSVYQDGVAPSKATVRSYEQTRNRVRVSGASEVQSGDFSAAFGLDMGGVPYDRDTSDTTSAHDGIETLVDSVGTRFKRAFATLYGGINPRGAYNAGTTYAENDSVSYQGSSYVSIAGSNTGNTPSSSPAQWQILSEAGVNTPIDWQGAYDNGTAYVVGDGVSYNGGSYVAVDDTTGNLPTDTDYWQVLAEQGEQGPQGDPGTNGTNGADGADGTDPGVLFNFDDGTADADPGSGNLRADNASLASATQLFVSEDNRAGSDVEAFLLAIDDSTNTIKGTLVLTDTTTLAQATFNVTGVTDATDYVKIAVSVHAGATTFTDANAISFQFTRAGDEGADGVGTGDVTGPASSTAGNLASFDDTTGKVIEDSGIAAANVLVDADIGTAVQAYDAGLADVAGLAVTDGNIIVGNGTNWVAESGSTARTSIGAAGTSQTEMIAGFIPVAEDGDITVILKSSYAFTVTKLVTQSASGTCTMTGEIDGVALGGTANSVSTSEVEQTHASANTVDAGDNLVAAISSNSSCEGVAFRFEITRTLQ